MQESSEVEVARRLLQAGLASHEQLTDARALVEKLKALGIERDLLGALVERDVLDRTTADGIRAGRYPKAAATGAGPEPAEAEVIEEAEIAEEEGVELVPERRPDGGAAPELAAEWISCPCGTATAVEDAKPGMRASCPQCGREFVLAESGFTEIAAAVPAAGAGAGVPAGPRHRGRYPGGWDSRARAGGDVLQSLRQYRRLAVGGAAIVAIGVILLALRGKKPGPAEKSEPGGKPEQKQAAEPVVPRKSAAPERPTELQAKEAEEKEALAAREAAAREAAAREALSEARGLLERDAVLACETLQQVARDYPGTQAARDAATEAELLLEDAEPEVSSLADTMEMMNRSVVMVRRKRGHGSGLLVKAPLGDAWYVATNRHVIEGALELKVFGFRGKEKVELSGAKIHAVHEDADLALIAIAPPPPGFKAARLGDADEVRQGDEVFTYGSPGGVEADKVLEQTATNGIVSARGREIEGQRCFQTTAAVNPGNSGGPLFTRWGEVVGINTYATVLEGTNFAIELGYLLDLLKGQNAIPEGELKELVLKADPMRMLRRRTLVARAKVNQRVAKLLVDPRRKKLLAFIRAENSIFLYELPGLGKTGELFVGSNPTDFDYDVDSGLAVVALSTPPQVAVFDLEKMQRVSLAETKRIHAIRWLGRSKAVAVREDSVPALRLVAVFGGWSDDVASMPEVDVLRVSTLSTASGRFLGDFRNAVLREEARTVKKNLDKFSRRVRFRTRIEADAAAKCIKMMKKRLKALETAFRAPALGVSPDRRTLVVAEPDEGGWTVFKMGTRSTFGTPKRFGGKVDFFLPDGEEGYHPDMQRVAFGREGGLFAFGDGVCDMRKARVVGTVKQVDQVWEKSRGLCNIFEVNSDASLGFTGTHIFSLKKFVPAARLPLGTGVMALGPEGKILYAYDHRHHAIVALSMEKLLGEGEGAPSVSDRPPTPSTPVAPTERPSSSPDMEGARRFGGHAYKLFDRRMSWHEAKRFCEEQGGHLVAIASPYENRFVAAMVRAARCHAWIGLTDEGHEGIFEWVTGEPVVFTAWGRKQPDNHRGREHCVHIRQDATWNDFHAGFSRRFVCEWDSLEE